MPHLLVALSSHGYGHWAQTAPVLNALRARLPDLRLTLCTTLAPNVLAQRLDGDFEHIAVASDVGMIMHDALSVNVEATARAYRRFHADWSPAVDAEARRLATLQPDLVLANVPYRTLAAAARAGIPTVTLCSLNWADVYQHYCGERPAAASLLSQMREAYATTTTFLQPTPSMPMDWLPQGRVIAPIARIGHAQRAVLRTRCQARDDQTLILVSLGGISTYFDPERWPSHERLRWIVPAAWGATRVDMVTVESLGMHFLDVLCSADVLLAKPGYGSFVEAACNETPVLYLQRDDWPETPYLESWLNQYGRCLPITMNRRSAHANTLHSEATTGKASVDEAIAAKLRQLLSQTPPPAPAPRGAQQAAAHLYQLLTTRKD